ncbi:MAG: Maf family protein [Clostridiales Family XIII bacterium]|jgi:septum formation protein|nr:Maf family protein [Clostridiales Family XIII bacterium]
MEILLASKSPRRYDIIEAHGVRPVVMPSDADESLPPDVPKDDPEAVVTYLARQKAFEVCGRVGNCDVALGGAPDGSAPIPAGSYGAAAGLPPILVAADTIVWLDRIIGKPVDENDAFRILSSYRNRVHEVWTGVTLIERVTGKEDTFAVRTRVAVGDFTDADVWEYIRTEQPFDKSGSYAIRSSWGKHITSVHGGVENVMGLPWPEVKEHLIPLLKGLARAILPARTRDRATAMGVRPTKVSVGNARKRWGSCNSKGGIRYTWRIMLGDDADMDYLVVHELAHLKHLNHSKRYWNFVASVLPDCKERRKKLRELYRAIEREGWG